MNLIQEKERELAELKRKTTQESWDSYMEKTKVFLDKLKGRVLLSWTQNGAFYMYKVIGYKEMYYANCEGFNGQWSPRRWFELETTAYLTFRVPYADGKFFKQIPPKIDENSWFTDFDVPHACTRLIRVKGKHKDSLVFPKFVMIEGELNRTSCAEANNIVTLGKVEYDTNVPDYANFLHNFCGFTVIMENDSIFMKALEIHKRQVLEVLEFYKEFEKDLNKKRPYTADLLK